MLPEGTSHDDTDRSVSDRKIAEGKESAYIYVCMHVCMYIMHAPTNRHIILYRIPTASTMPARPSMLDLCMSACMYVCMYVCRVERCSCGLFCVGISERRFRLPIKQVSVPELSCMTKRDVLPTLMVGIAVCMYVCMYV